MSSQSTPGALPCPTPTVTPLADMNEFKQAVSAYVEADNEAMRLHQSVVDARQRRSALQPRICNFLERHQLHQQEIGISDGTIRYARENTKPALSQRLLADHLPEFFRGDTSALTPEQRTEALLQFLNSKRVPESKSVLRRKYTATDGAQ